MKDKGQEQIVVKIQMVHAMSKLIIVQCRDPCCANQLYYIEFMCTLIMFG